MRIGTVTLLKTPVERATSWVAYHLNAGIDEIHLFFDDPDDPAADAFADYPQVHVYRCDEAFWRAWRPGGRERPVRVPGRQVSILRQMLRHPPAGLDWIISIDSDELLWSDQDLRESLETLFSCSDPHVQFLPLEAVPPTPGMKDAFREVQLFKEMTVDRQDLARRFHADDTFRGRRFFRGHVRGKPAIKLDGQVRTMRIHGPTDQHRAKREFTTRISDTVRLLHYDAGSFSDWREKWQERLDHPVGAMGPARRRQERRFRRANRGARKISKLRELYRREYMLQAWEARVLRVLGMVKKIVIPESMFQLPAPSGAPAVMVPAQRDGRTDLLPKSNVLQRTPFPGAPATPDVQHGAA